MSDQHKSIHTGEVSQSLANSLDLSMTAHIRLAGVHFMNELPI